MFGSWNPTKPYELKGKEAFNKLGHSADKVVLQSTGPAQPNKFILHSRGYFDLQSYVLTGRDFPQSYSDFETKIPKTAFKRLSDIDSGIYDKTRDAMIAVGSTCEDYHRNHLAEIVTAGKAAIQYSNSTVELLETATDINLRHNLDILLNEKYTSTETFDDAYRSAKNGAKLALGVLSRQAKEKKHQTEKITESLVRFKEVTIKNKPDIQFLISQYKTGPVTNDSDEKTPYLDYLNQDLADSLDNFNKLVEEAKFYQDLDDTHTDIISVTKFSMFGWVAMLLLEPTATKIREAHEDLQNQITKLREERKEEADLISFVSTLIYQCTDIEGKMEDAIKAMTELSHLFSNQSDCYNDIASYLDSMEPSTDLGELSNRKAWIQHNTKSCVEKLKQLKVVAEEFTNSIIDQVKL